MAKERECSLASSLLIRSSIEEEEEESMTKNERLIESDLFSMRINSLWI